MKLSVAFLTTDSREHYRRHAEPRPFFGTAPAALLQGFEVYPVRHLGVLIAPDLAELRRPKTMDVISRIETANAIACHSK